MRAFSSADNWQSVVTNRPRDPCCNWAPTTGLRFSGFPSGSGVPNASRDLEMLAENGVVRRAFRLRQRWTGAFESSRVVYETVTRTA